MQHKTLEQLKRVAEGQPDPDRPAMSRSEKLERWADLLDRDPGRRLSTLPGTEYEPAERRDPLRSPGSPIWVAFADPVLRAEGLTNDTYGEAKRFFELSDWQLHEIVCYCHFGATMTAGAAARHVRAAIGGPEQRGVFARLQDAFVRF
jgi:hypothetical protein